MISHVIHVSKKSLLLLLTFVLVLGVSIQNTQAETVDTVAQAIAKPNGTSLVVQGYIVGVPVNIGQVQFSNFTSDYALAIADSASETQWSKMLLVQLDTQYRASFGLKTNPSLKGSIVKVTGKRDTYFSGTGLKYVTSIAKVTSDGGGGTDPDTGTPPSTEPNSTYYETAYNKTGSSLKSALHNIIDDHKKLSYDAVWGALRDTDQDPNNTSNVILLYTGRSQSKLANGGLANDWNREHVWAKSHGDFGTTAGAGTDIHHLRPADVSVNSARGNLDFDNGGSYHIEATLCRYDSDSWEPRDAVKGDVARMLFYMAVRYEGDISGEPNLELNNLVNNGTAPYHGKLSVLLQWHQQDPVDAFEKRRNEIIYSKYQGNRNPFIDHPEWVSLIWQ